MFFQNYLDTGATTVTRQFVTEKELEEITGIPEALWREYREAQAGPDYAEIPDTQDSPRYLYEIVTVHNWIRENIFFKKGEK